MYYALELSFVSEGNATIEPLALFLSPQGMLPPR